MSTAPEPKRQKTESFSDQMRVYYRKLFPFNDFFKWLSYGKDDPSYNQRREICFTLEGDIFIRFLSFSKEEDLAKAVREKNPAKIDIGPVYNVDPSKRQAYQGTFAPVERELVFDIDMNDYNDVRRCCDGADVCNKCWPLMTCALQVIDACLREDFGFEHIFWVYSGRRGIHAWVCDARARRLTEEQRGSIVEYLKVYMGKEGGRIALKKLRKPYHPSLARALEQLHESFEGSLLLSQKVLETPEAQEKVLAYLPDGAEETEAIRDAWAKKIPKDEDDIDINLWRWREFKRILGKPKDKKSVLDELRNVEDRIVLAHTYPRLDVEVSKHLNHLLKAPFCVHPKTGKVCVPIDPEHALEFDPHDEQQVPTLRGLLQELEGISGEDAEKDPWKRTAMNKAVKSFRKLFLRDVLKAERKGAGKGGATGADW